jgi:hypothetical protein
MSGSRLQSRQLSQYSVQSSFFVTPFRSSSLRMYSKSIVWLGCAGFLSGKSAFSIVASSMLSACVQSILAAVAASTTRFTVLRDTPAVLAMFLSLKPRCFSRRISRYLVM